MKVVLSKSEIVSLIGKIQNVISSKPAIPVLANLLMEAQDDQLIISATDLTVSMRLFADAKVIEEGAIALPARRLFHLIRELTVPQIKITTHENNIAEVKASSSSFKIHGLHYSEFPKMPNLEEAMQISLKSEDLKDFLSRCSFASAREDSRYVLNGVLMSIENQKATFIGTDGKRLAKTSSPLEIDPAFIGSYILPLKAVDEMVRILDGEERILLYLMKDKVSLEKGNLALTTKLLSGQYPEVEKVIPQNPKHEISLHREELMTLLKQVSLFTIDTSSSVRFCFEKGQLTLTAISQEIGEGKVMMPVDFSEEKLEVAFNPYYFLDILRHSKDETITFSINDAYNPGLITDSTSALFVIMPMRLAEATIEPNVSEKSVLA